MKQINSIGVATPSFPVGVLAIDCNALVNAIKFRIRNKSKKSIQYVAFGLATPIYPAIDCNALVHAILFSPSPYTPDCSA